MSLEIIKQALAEHDPVAVYACFSGGHDSLCSTHLSMGIAQEVLHINTGIGIEQTRTFVRDTCKRYDWPLKEVHPPEMSYRDLVLKFGFPGPGMHYLPYRLLKERALRKVVREAKRKTRDRVMFITGVRQSESARRMGYVEPIIRVGAQVWVAPLWNWNKRQCNEYIEANKLERNEVSDLLHMSGECLCGAFADQHTGMDRHHELKEIELWFPDTAAQIYALEKEAEAAGVHCEWGRRPPRDTKTMNMFMPMCVGCENRAVAGPQTQEEK